MISLVLATYGRSDDIGRFVESLRTQTDARFELIIVDQNPDDRVLPYVRQANDVGIACTHVRLAQPNLSAARNIGLRIARGEWIAFPDDDCWYENDTMAKAISEFEVKPELAGIVINWVEQSERLGVPLTGQALSKAAWRAYRGGEASSISLFFRTALLRELQGFDERMGVGQWFGAAEEIDLILRVLNGGAVLQRCAEARVHHAYGGRPNLPISKLWQANMARARGTGAIYSKHDLALWTATRGVIAPVLKSLARPRLENIAIGLATSVGRWQGMRAWR